MKSANQTELYALYKDTLSHVGTFLLTCEREEIEYHLFEEFDTDCTSFLHETNLRALLEERLISPEIYAASLRLAADYRALEGTDLWDPETVTTAAVWRRVLELADTVRDMTGDFEGS